MGPGQEEVVGMASGSGYKFYVPLFSAFIPMGIGDDSFKAALEDALTNTKAHSLINVFADQQCIFFPLPQLYLIARCETRLTGTAIRYKELKSNSYFEAMGKLSPDEAKIRSDERVSMINKMARMADETVYDILVEKLSSLETKALLDVAWNVQVRMGKYITTTKGKKVGRWFSKFVIDPALPEKERQFVIWFLARYGPNVTIRKL